jgi:hypothetical protein
MGNNKTTVKRKRVQEFRKEARTNECSSVPGKNRMSVEESSQGFSKLENSV